MQWKKRKQETDLDLDVRTMSKKYNISLILASIFARRSVLQEKDIKFFLKDDIENIYSPFCFNDMYKFIERINEAKYKDERVFVFGDRDVDGITSISMLVSYLQEEGLRVSWSLPIGDESYGISKEAIDEEYAKNKIGLIITVDCGTSSNEEIEYALEKYGIDTLVVDHHNPKDDIPRALAIINPKMKDSGYPYPNLCTGTLVFKIIWALKWSSLEYFTEEFNLVYAEEKEDCIELQIIIMKDLRMKSRTLFKIKKDFIFAEENFFKFFSSKNLLFYIENKEKENLYYSLFSQISDLNPQNITELIWQIIPKIKNRSLNFIISNSRFMEKDSLEIDILKELFLKIIFVQFDFKKNIFENTLDLVSIATLADMMPLENENRIMVKIGLKYLKNTQNVGLKKMLEKLNLYGQDLEIENITWRISPLINSTGRMGEPYVSVKLLLGEDADENLDRILKLDKERRKIGEQAWKNTLDKAQNSYQQHKNKLVLVQDESIHRGITGILSGRFLRKFGVPSIAIASLKDKFVGSMRSTEGFVVTDFLENFSDFFTNWGGHNSAGGFNMPTSNFNPFLEKILETSKNLDVSNSNKVIYYDVEIPKNYISLKLFEELVEIHSLLKPYGQKWRAPIFMFKGALLKKIEKLNGKTLMLKLNLYLEGLILPAIYWEPESDFLEKYSEEDKVDLLFSLDRNNFRGNTIDRLLIISIKKD